LYYALCGLLYVFDHIINTGVLPLGSKYEDAKRFLKMCAPSQLA